MTSLAARYEAGEWTEVWAEIRQLGPVAPSHRDDVEEVARSTMRRARLQIERIVERLLAMAFEPASSIVPVFVPPPHDVTDRVANLELSLGPIPEALKASMFEIGAVTLLGDCAAVGLYYHGGPPPRATTMPPGADYPDPLCLPGVDWLELEWDARQHDSLEPLDEPFQFAPDELHKANIMELAEVSLAADS